MSSWRPLGSLLRASWILLEALGAIMTALGAILSALGTICGRLGAILGRLRIIALGASWEAFERVVEAFCSHVGGLLELRRNFGSILEGISWNVEKPPKTV